MFNYGAMLLKTKEGEQQIADWIWSWGPVKQNTENIEGFFLEGQLLQIQRLEGCTTFAEQYVWRNAHRIIDLANRTVDFLANASICYIACAYRITRFSLHFIFSQQILS